MIEINQLGVILAVVMTIAFVIAFILPFFWKTKEQNFVLTKKEIKRYREESIAIQAFNSTIFNGKDLHEVISEGNKIIELEGNRFFQGVNCNDV